MPRSNKTRFTDCMKLVNVSVNLEIMVVIINNVRMKINVDVNVKN